VSWHSHTSEKFIIGNGTRQVSILSPYLFTCYVRPLIRAVVQSRLGCNNGGLVVNILAYADDMIILAPSWYAMQDLLKILEMHCHKLDIICNTKKTVCMMFKPIRKACIVSQAFPPFTLNNDGLCYVCEFRYLGHIINDRLQDDCDIRREIRSLFARTILLINKFGNCSYAVKKLLFKSYCLCMYNLALWKYYSVTVFNKFKSCYNRCVKIFFGFYRVTLC